MKTFELYVTGFLVLCATFNSNCEEANSDNLEQESKIVNTEESVSKEEEKNENIEEEDDPYQKWKLERDALYEQKQESVNEVDTDPGYEKWLRQRDSIPDELHEEDRKRKEEEDRRREEERKRYEDIDIPDDAEWKTIDVGAHHREIMEQHERYEEAMRLEEEQEEKDQINKARQQRGEFGPDLGINYPKYDDNKDNDEYDEDWDDWEDRHEKEPNPEDDEESTLDSEDLYDRNCPMGMMECPTTGDCIENEQRCDGHPDCEDEYDEEDCDNYDPEEEYERQEFERQRQRRRRYYEREEDEIIDEDAEDDEEDEFDDYDDYPPEDEFDARLDLTDEEREEYAEYRREMMIKDRQRRAKRSMHAMDGYEDFDEELRMRRKPRRIREKEEMLRRAGYKGYERRKARGPSEHERKKLEEKRAREVQRQKLRAKLGEKEWAKREAWRKSLERKRWEDLEEQRRQIYHERRRYMTDPDYDPYADDPYAIRDDGVPRTYKLNEIEPRLHQLRVDKDGVQEEGPYAGRKNPEYTRRPRMRRYRPPPPPEDYEQPEEEEHKKKKKKRKGPIFCPEDFWHCTESRQCIHETFKCDGHNHCMDASDESNCTAVVNSTSAHNKTETTNNTIKQEQDKQGENPSMKTKSDSKQKKIGGKRKGRKNTIHNENKFENITTLQDNSTAYNETAEEKDEL